MKMRMLAVSAAALALPFTAACGGKDDTNSGSRPTVAELEAWLTEEAGPGKEEQVSCVAEGIHSSDLPNGVVRKLLSGENAEIDKKNKDRYEGIVNDISLRCQSAG